MNKLIGSVTSGQLLTGKLSETTPVIGVVSVGSAFVPDIYDGDYIIVPKADEEQELQTKDKLLKENVTVKAVPYYEVSNLTGNTVFIASEV